MKKSINRDRALVIGRCSSMNEPVHRYHVDASRRRGYAG